MKKLNEVTADEVAGYLVGRLRRNRGAANGPAVETRPGEKPAPAHLEALVAELSELVIEKEDSVAQINSDRRFLAGEGRSVSQEEVLRAVEEPEAEGSAGLRRLAAVMTGSQGIEGAVKASTHRLDEICSRIGELIENEAVRNGYEAKLSKRIGVIRASRCIQSLEKIMEQSELARMELFARRSSGNMSLTRADGKIIERYDEIGKAVLAQIERLMSDEDVYYESKRRVLLEYRRQLLNDGFVETPGVKAEMLRIVSHLKLGIPVLLRGHLGAGKTEIALHVSRKYFGSEPEFISGSEEATKYDIYGRTQIGMRPEEERTREFKARMEEFLRMNPDATRKEIKEAERQYYDTIVVKGLSMSFFQYGPLVRAMREGKPLLIDEMDGIPHSILMRLNHVLTRKPGDRIKVQENGGEEVAVKKGFAVIATGNIKSARYKREELDAAFLSRWWSDDIIYPSQEETNQILVASLLDKRGNLQVKDPGDLDGLKRLTQAASEIQRIFSGDHLDYYGEGADAARQIPASLKKSVLSLRHLWNVVRPWKAQNFDSPLEHYILNEFVKPSVAEDQLYLVQLLCRYRFFKTWPSSRFGIPGLTDAKLAAFQGKSARQAAV